MHATINIKLWLNYPSLVSFTFYYYFSTIWVDRSAADTYLSFLYSVSLLSLITLKTFINDPANRIIAHRVHILFHRSDLLMTAITISRNDILKRPSLISAKLHCISCAYFAAPKPLMQIIVQLNLFHA